MNTLLMSLMIMIMSHEMPKLPYANNALEPVISQQTIDYHYGKHLQTYVNNLNNLVPGTEYEKKDLVTIVATAPDGAIFNNAGQVLNHTLYFLQFSPKPSQSEPTGKLAEAIKRDFGSFENFKKEFNAAAVGLFGSGWAWLSVDKTETAYHQRSERKQPRTFGTDSAAGLRCLGTCILSGLSEQTRRPRQRSLEHRRLGCCGQTNEINPL